MNSSTGSGPSNSHQDDSRRGPQRASKEPFMSSYSSTSNSANSIPHPTPPVRDPRILASNPWSKSNNTTPSYRSSNHSHSHNPSHTMYRSGQHDSTHLDSSHHKQSTSHTRGSSSNSSSHATGVGNGSASAGAGGGSNTSSSHNDGTTQGRKESFIGSSSTGSSSSSGGGGGVTSCLLVDNLDAEYFSNSMDKILRLFGQYGSIAGAKVLGKHTVSSHKSGNNTSSTHSSSNSSSSQNGPMKKMTCTLQYVRFEDAAKALNALQTERFGAFRLRIEWSNTPLSKSSIPNIPIYVPNRQCEADFVLNAAREHSLRVIVPDFTEIPSDQRYLMDVMASYVVHSGCNGMELEHVIAERERGNAVFEMFLSAPEGSPHRIYYQWRVYSLSQGDTLVDWRSAPFLMFSDGPVWYPPNCSVNSSLVATRPQVRPSLRRGDRELLFKLLRRITTIAHDVYRVSAFVLERAHVLADITEVLVDALLLKKTPFDIRLARFYVMNDVLHNAKKGTATRHSPNAKSFIGAFLPHLEVIVAALVAGVHVSCPSMKHMPQQAIPGAFHGQELQAPHEIDRSEILHRLDQIHRVIQSWKDAWIYPPSLCQTLLDMASPALHSSTLEVNMDQKNSKSDCTGSTRAPEKRPREDS